MKGLMSEADRKLLFGDSTPAPSHPAPTQQQQDRDYPTKAEKQEHDELITYLKHKGWFYRHSRMDKPTTEQVGQPDFIVGLYGRGVCIEFKLPGRKLTKAQEQWQIKAYNSDWPYYVFATAVEAIRMLETMEKHLRYNHA